MNPTDQVRVTKPAVADWSGGPAFLRDTDRKRLRNLFERTIGRGFKMAVVEIPTPREGDELLQWLRPHFAAAGAAEHVLHLPTLLGPPDEKRRLRRTVWEALTQILPPAEVAGQRAVLVLRGIEDLQYADQQNRFDLLQQFNVQRDLLVRDYPCFWLLLIHPRSRHHWHLVAPDFSDFVALWIEAAEPKPMDDQISSINLSAEARFTGSAGFAPDDWPELLRQAVEDIRLSKYDEAVDKLHTFLAQTPDTPETERDRAIARMLETDIWVVRGQNQQALGRLQESLAVFERVGADYERAAAIRRIADVLQARGERDEALRIRREEELPVYERLGDVRSRAITMGRIAGILQARGELDEALRILREEELPVYERLGDVRSRAITVGRITDILQARGELDEALRIRREEQLPVYERLGDVRSRAITMSRIADILQARGELDEALRILREEGLPVYERLGDVRSQAMALGRIADILQARGELDEALRIRRDEQLPIYERLGDVLLRAITETQLAMGLIQRNRVEDAQQICELLSKALADLERLKLPEAAWVRHILFQWLSHGETV